VTEAAMVIVRHLEMTSRDQLRPGSITPAGIRFRRVEEDRAAVAMACYHLVGAAWSWVDRRDWDEAQWQSLLDEEAGELWVAREGEQVAGYAQLARRGDEVAIHYFGLAPGFIGRGIGGWMLTRTIERAWAMGATRVVLNTCTLDGPAALPNYLARGFTVVREEHRPREVDHGSL
jgi:GNAT superfamily N-acetyltransferase